MKKLLEQRKNLKAKKPTFRRQDSHKKPKLSPAWRRPKGSDSKMRRGLRGYLRSPRIGWGSPKQVKGLSKEGLVPVVVANVKDCEKLDAKENVAIVSANTGKKKRIQIIKLLVDKKIKIENIKDPSKYIKNIEDAFKKAKEDKEKAKKEKEKKKKAKEKKAESEKKKEEASDNKEGELEKKVDEKKKEEVEEKQKIITKKE